jgi:hypothetical protein
MTKTTRLLAALFLAAAVAACATMPPPPAPSIPAQKLDAKTQLETGRDS